MRKAVDAAEETDVLQGFSEVVLRGGDDKRPQGRYCGWTEPCSGYVLQTKLLASVSL